MKYHFCWFYCFNFRERRCQFHLLQ